MCIRDSTLGTAQRSAMHFASKTDADEAYMVGAEAVHYALADKSGVMVTLERTSDAPYQCTCGEVALDLVANNEQKVPLSWITKQANYVTDEFITLSLIHI